MGTQPTAQSYRLPQLKSRLMHSALTANRWSYREISWRHYYFFLFQLTAFTSEHIEHLNYYRRRCFGSLKQYFAFPPKIGKWIHCAERTNQLWWHTSSPPSPIIAWKNINVASLTTGVWREILKHYYLAVIFTLNLSKGDEALVMLQQATLDLLTTICWDTCQLWILSHHLHWKQSFNGQYKHKVCTGSYK